MTYKITSFRVTLAAALLAGAIPTVSGQDALLDLGEYRPPVVGEVVSQVPQYAVCYNSVDNEYFVVAQGTTQSSDGSSGISIFGQRVNGDTGEPVGGPVTIDEGGADLWFSASAPSVAHAPTTNRYMVCYRIGEIPYAKFLNSAGGWIEVEYQVYNGSRAWPNGRVPLNETNTGYYGNAITYTPGFPAEIAFDGTAFMAVFFDWERMGTWDSPDQAGLFARRFDTNGHPIGPNAINPKVKVAPYSEQYSIAYLGGAAKRFLVAYMSPSVLFEAYDPVTYEPITSGPRPTIKCVVVTTDGKVWPEQSVSAPDTLRHIRPRVAANATDQEWLVVWEKTDGDWWSGAGVGWAEIDKPLNVADIAFRRIDSGGYPMGGGSRDLLLQAGLHMAPDVVWNDLDDVYVVHWQDGDLGASEVRGTKIVGGSDTVVTRKTAIGAGLTPSLAVRGGDSHALSIWGSGTRLKGRIVNALIRPVVVAESALQFQPDGETPLVPGGFSRGPSFVAKVKILDSEDSDVLLMLEVREADVPFSNEPTHAGLETAASGDFASAAVDGLKLDKAYHWQAAGVNSIGKMSPWSPGPSDPAFVTRANAAPVATAPRQYVPGGAPIALGQVAYAEDGVMFQGVVGDPDGDPVRLEIEVRSAGVAFSNVATATGRLFAGGPVALAVQLPDGSYHWQYRAFDKFGAHSAWTPFAEGTSADFELVARGSQGASSCLGSVPCRAAPWLQALSALLILIRGLRRREV